MMFILYFIQNMHVEDKMFLENSSNETIKLKLFNKSNLKYDIAKTFKLIKFGNFRQLF